MSATYQSWGFKLNLMYARIPTKYFINLHNFQEFDTPRIDVGLLTASYLEHMIYGSNTALLPSYANLFYNARSQELFPLLAASLVRASVVAEESDVVFAKTYRFIHPSQEVPGTQLDCNKLYIFFALYWHADSPGTSAHAQDGIPFLRFFAGRCQPAPTPEMVQWRYFEIRLAQGPAEYQYRPFIFAPLFIAYFDNYTDLMFNADDDLYLPIYQRHIQHCQVSADFKRPFADFIGRETISRPDSQSRFIVSWDGKPVDRSVVASQSYYDMDDDLQSAHGDALLEAEIKVLQQRLALLEKSWQSSKSLMRKT